MLLIAELAEMLKKAMTFEGRTKGRDKIINDHLDNRHVVSQLIEVYRKVCVR